GPSRIVAVFVGPEYGVVVHREPGEIGSPDVVEELPIAPTTNVMLIRFGVLVELVLLQVATRRRSVPVADLAASPVSRQVFSQNIFHGAAQRPQSPEPRELVHGRRAPLWICLAPAGVGEQLQLVFVPEEGVAAGTVF